MEQQKPFWRWKNIFRAIGTLVSIFGVFSPALPLSIPADAVILGMGLPYYLVIIIAGIIISVLPTLWEAADRSSTKSLTSLIKAWKGGDSGPGGPGV